MAANIYPKLLIATFIFATFHPVYGNEKSADLGSLNQIHFFEEKVRPLLSEHCYECHAESSKKLKGGLLLDSKAGWMRGGDTGPAIIPGDAKNSLFAKMIQHEPNYDAMPPKNKLQAHEIQDLLDWINNGAFDPRDQAIGELKNVDYFDIEERKKWWAFQPITNPKIPRNQNTTWASNSFDRFILAELENKNWSPAVEADKAILLRRLSFDIIGLAPTPQEIEEFLNDSDPDAYEKQVDRLLKSPHYGEKWARHWMDAVRYGESKSFEADYTMSHAHQYRNYLINMFNADVPYNDFIRESFAGDLLKEPRFDSTGAINQSIMGPGFMYLTDGQHGPPDLHEDEARIMSGIIDTTSKAFLGMTVACARCHDHKFDAITTGDYYSWYGMMRSSRLEISNTIADHLQITTRNKLKSLEKRFYEAAMEDAFKDVNQITDSIVYAKKLLSDPAYIDYIKAHKISAKNNKERQAKHKEIANKEKALAQIVSASAKKNDLDAMTLLAWLHFSRLHKNWPQLEPLYAALTMEADHDLESRPLTPKNINTNNYPSNTDGWIKTGPAFQEIQDNTHAKIIPSVNNRNHAIQSMLHPSYPVSGQYSGRITGSLRSPDFTLDGNPIELFAKGKNARINLIIRNYEQAGFGPTTRGLSKPINHSHWQQIKFETSLWKGLSAYIEVLHDGEARRLKAPLGRSADDSFVAISTEPSLLDTSKVWKGSSLVESLTTLLTKAKNRSLTRAESEVLAALFESKLLRSDTERSTQLAAAVTAYKNIHNELPQPIYARSLTDGTPQDEPIYIRGNHKSLSQDPNPRRFLDALGGQHLPKNSSGRLEFAEQLVSKENPLVPRTIVNRIWHHIFGRGLVSSLEDLGKLGALPSHPELLDHLAQDFMQNNWSIKSIIRKMVTSSTYKMSSNPSSAALELDPDNIYLQRMPIKKLEAEQIRDHILFVSNELNRTLLGKSVPAYTLDLPKARGHKPSGPVDGLGRRSIYTELRRNFMPSFLRVMGMPNGLEPIGARNVTNIPAQSLALMNSEFTRQQSEKWAQYILNQETTELSRFHLMHKLAFGRAAKQAELTWAQATLNDLRSFLGIQINLNTPPILFDDFESGKYTNWYSEGTAFGDGPLSKNEIAHYQKLKGYQGSQFINTHNVRQGKNISSGDAPTGTLRSKPFKIKRKFIHVLISGGNNADQTGLQVIIDGEVIAKVSGDNSNTMSPKIIDVSQFQGQIAEFKVLDQASGHWGHIGIDHILFSDNKNKSKTSINADLQAWQELCHIMINRKEFIYLL